MWKKSLFLPLILLYGALSAAVPEENSFVYKFTYQRPLPLKVSPAQKIRIEQPQIVENRKVFLLKREDAKKGLCGYWYFSGMFNKNKHTAPGTMVISWRDKFTGEFASPAYVATRYTMPNAPRGSAGRESHHFKPQNSWQNRSQEFTVPPDTADIQYIFGFDGKKDSAMMIEQITFEYAPDNVKLVSGTPVKDLPPSKWKRAAQLDAFFTPGRGQLAEARTTVKMLFDSINLYVGFIAEEPLMAQIKANETRRDGKVYADDCVEFYIFDPVSDTGRHFMANTLNTQYDCQLKQAQAGDPYRRHPWDGKWTSQVWKNANSFEILFTVPWKTLGFDSVPQHRLSVNFARERAVKSEISQWNNYSGNFSDVTNYASVSFAEKFIRRHRKIEKINYLPQRPRKVFKEVLSNKPNDWRSYIWSNEYQLSSYPAEVRKKYDLDSFLPFQKKLLENWSRAKMSGMHIFSLWAPRVTRLKLADYLKIHEATGIRFPLTPWIDPAGVAAQGAVPKGKVVNNRVSIDPIHPLAAKRLERGMELMRETAVKTPGALKLISHIQGMDEPCNRVRMLYSRTFNPDEESRKWLTDRLEKEIKSGYGFGKYGLFDDYAPVTDNTPFERIAFWRWWNDRLAEYVDYVTKAAAKHLPGTAFLVWNRNSCAGNDQIDVALAGRTTYTVSCDPYPTSARAQFGMGRALYHTGFSVKMLRDLAPSAQISMYGQAFNYHQAQPKRAEVREWTSQALKNGLTELKWYGGGVMTGDLNAELYNEVMEITRQVSGLSTVTLPRETKSAIYYSDYDRWALEDRPTHASYVIYSLLGEHINSWFRFVSRSNFNLDGIKLLYIPRMRFTEPVLTEKIVRFVENGGTAVIFDPDFFKFNIDGSAVAERGKLLNFKLTAKPGAGAYLLYKNKRMPLTEIKHIEGPEANKIYAFDIEKIPANAKVLATYSDKKPAIIEYACGKGRVIFSAVMPFGSSDAAIAPGAWKEFAADLAEKVGEKTGLDVWFFELPEVTPKTFDLKPLK